jgi:hypothetical protein
MQSVVFTAVFERHAKDAGLSDDEMIAIADKIGGKSSPRRSDSRNRRREENAVRACGQRQERGYRTIHYFGGDDIPVFLLALIDKGKRADLSQAERNALSKLLAGIGAAYREDPAANIKPA